MKLEDVKYIGMSKEELEGWTIHEDIYFVGFTSPDKTISYGERDDNAYAISKFDKFGRLIYYLTPEGTIDYYVYKEDGEQIKVNKTDLENLKEDLLTVGETL
jgi:hypothetical protein